MNREAFNQRFRLGQLYKFNTFLERRNEPYQLAKYFSTNNRPALIKATFER